MGPEEHQSLHAIVEGHVQGVGFRFFVQDFAERRGLTGWVRNREERQVEVYAEGSHADLSRLIGRPLPGTRRRGSDQSRFRMVFGTRKTFPVFDRPFRTITLALHTKG